MTGFSVVRRLSAPSRISCSAASLSGFSVARQLSGPKSGIDFGFIGASHTSGMTPAYQLKQWRFCPLHPYHMWVLLYYIQEHLTTTRPTKRGVVYRSPTLRSHYTIWLSTVKQNFQSENRLEPLRASGNRQNSSSPLLFLRPLLLIGVQWLADCSCD